MIRLGAILDRARPAFEPGRPLGSLRCVFNAVEHFLLWTAAPTTCAPHVRDPLDIKRLMSIVIIALLPCVAAGVYLFGTRLLVMILVSYLAGGAVEVLFAVVRKQEINEGFLVTGLLFPLILPTTLPLWMVAVGVAFGVIVGKEIFGGTGRNLFNPALVGRCFLLLAYSEAMSSGWVLPGRGWPGRLTDYITTTDVDAVTSATPLGAMATDPTGLWELFTGQCTGCAGSTSALAILIGGSFLLITRVANWRIPLGCLGAFAVAAWVAGRVDGGAFGPVAYHLLGGGLLFGAVFMATDPVSAPGTNPGRWVYGILIGLLVFLIRGFTPLAEGVMFAILLGNIAAPILDEIVVRSRMRRIARAR